MDDVGIWKASTTKARITKNIKKATTRDLVHSRTPAMTPFATRSWSTRSSVTMPRSRSDTPRTPSSLLDPSVTRRSDVNIHDVAEARSPS